MSIFLTDSEEFKSQRLRNPENLRNRCDFCKSPQPRYKDHLHTNSTFSESKYLLQTQCLPGCFATTVNTTNVEVGHPSAILGREVVSIQDDIECDVYAPRENNIEPPKALRSSASKLFEQGKKPPGQKLGI